MSRHMLLAALLGQELADLKALFWCLIGPISLAAFARQRGHYDRVQRRWQRRVDAYIGDDPSVNRRGFLDGGFARDDVKDVTQLDFFETMRPAMGLVEKYRL
jgi:hypothetical protein